MDNTKEIWKTYPEFDFIEASNLGRVRTKDRYVMRKGKKKYHVKGHILNQWLNPSGYMYVTFNANGKHITKSVHRIVATTFLSNPDNLPEVNHKDNNRTNNAVSNLEWCTRQYNEDYKKNFGTSPAEIQGHPVTAVNLETGKVLHFGSQSEAARYLGIDVGNVNSVVKGRLNQAGGYLFAKNENEITKERIRKIKKHMKSFPVIAINIETLEVVLFESRKEASCQLEVNRGNISSVTKGKRNTAGGHWFCYADENAVENARVKFGDEVAEKVEELIKENQN